MAKRNLTQLAYDALTLEGGLFNAEWLAQVAHLSAPQQKPEDYGVPAGLVLRDEIARAWRISQALWNKFHPSIAAGSSGTQLATEKFVVALLEQAFGFNGLSRQAAPNMLGERSFPITYSLGNVPLVIAAHNEGLEEGQQRFGEAGRRRSPFGVMQEYLNAAADSLWGLVSNGLTLRLLRDNVSLTRPAWLEADLDRLFTEERFADFSALWLTIHVSRFGRAGALPTDCPLEVWRTAGQQAGTRARDELRKGVERAVLALGQGFLADPSNATLRSALVDGSVTPQSYFQQLLRMVYRIIFLITVEERGVLHPPGRAGSAAQLYERGYGLRRLRERAVRHSAHDVHRDLYETLKVSFRGLASGEPRLALPALGGLFGSDQTLLLDGATLQNRHLLSAIWALAWIARDGATERVNWRDMGPEELGSVYESLLELIPEVGEGALSFKFAGGDETRGNARRLSGSYYTPDSLVQALLDSALEPLIAKRKAERPDDEAAAILSISVIDPAVGSGHFLLSAARRLAAHLARTRAQGQPSAAEHRRAVRDVVSHCLFGVDRNPMALELARIALWLEAMTPDAPLSFLDAHLVLGDALLGVLNPEMLAHGIPDDAFTALTGDDKETCARLKERNRSARKTLEKLTAKGGQGLLAFATKTAAAELARVDAMPDDTLEAISAKRRAWNELHKAQEQGGLAEDLFVAAFLTLKEPAGEADVPTTEHLLRALSSQPIPQAVIDKARALARAHHVFHWRDAFAQIFERGGFDCVLGNPPWETMSPDGKEFFSTYDPQVRFMSPDEQKAAFAGLLERPAIAEQWDHYCRTLYTHVQFYKTSARYRLFAPGNLGKGDLNVYRMFVETALETVRNGGCAAQFVPEGLYNGANAAAIRTEIFERFQLERLVGFENSRGIWFPAVDTRAKFCLYVAWKGGSTTEFPAAFLVKTAKGLADSVSGAILKIPVSLVAEFSPDAMAVMEFASQREIDICRKMYARYPKFGEVIEGLPLRVYMREIDMGTDRGLFSDGDEGLPVFEGRMIDAFDYRAKGYKAGRGRAADWEDCPFGHADKAVRPQWRVVEESLPDKLRSRAYSYRIGFCDVASPTNSRSLVAALLPPNTVSGHKVPTIMFENGDATDMLLWLGVANALCFDFLVRKKVSLTMSYTIMDSLPFPRGRKGTPDTSAIARRVYELCAVGAEMERFRDIIREDKVISADAIPTEDPLRRAQLMAEIDCLVGRSIYGLTREEMSYICDPANVLGGDCGIETFRALRDWEMRQYGEYRTQRLVLEAWDSLSQRASMPASRASRRSTPRGPYLPSAVPCCEAEAWLAGLVCDVVVYGGAMSEPDLRLVLAAGAAGQAQTASELTQWTSKERLDRLPQILTWLRQLLGIQANRDLIISAGTDLTEVPGDEKTEQLARALVDAYRAQQAQLDKHRPAETIAAAASPPGARDRRA